VPDDVTTLRTTTNLLPDQQAIETLLSLAETYAGHANTMAAESKGTVKGAREGDSNLQTAEADLKVRLSSAFVSGNRRSADQLQDPDRTFRQFNQQR
jgi:Family of unknown function (DUF5923)